MLSKVELEGQ